MSHNKLLTIFSIIALVFGTATSMEKSAVVPERVITDFVKDYLPPEIQAIDQDLKTIRNITFETLKSKEVPIYISTTGGPGASKTTILESYLAEVVQNPAAYIDPDQRGLKYMVHTYIPSLNNRAIAMDGSFSTVLTKAYTKWRGASNYIANSLLNEAVNNKFDIAHGTTATAPQVENLYKGLKARGYRIVLLLCGSTDENRISASENRFTTQGFYQATAEDTVNKGKMFYDRMPVYFKYADEIRIYWTENFEKGSILAATYSRQGPQDGAQIKIENIDAYEGFVAEYEKARKQKSDLPEWGKF